MMRNILITGGCGFIGSYVVRLLLGEGCYNIFVLDNLSSGSITNLPEKLNMDNFFQCDVTDQHAINECLKAVDQIEFIVHLAANVSVVRSLNEPTFSANVNICGFVNILELAKRYNSRVIYASSAAVYGNSNQFPFIEGVSPKPISPYGLEKVVNEYYANLYRELYALDIIGLRFFNVYGAGQNPDSPYSGVITKFLKNIDNGLPVTIYGDGSQIRDFIHVKDVATAVSLAIKAEHVKYGVFNICSGLGSSLLEIIAILENILNTEITKSFAPWRGGDILKSVGSNVNARIAFDFKHSINLKQGLVEML
jgi:UDP-glucose 4-epimerase